MPKFFISIFPIFLIAGFLILTIEYREDIYNFVKESTTKRDKVQNNKREEDLILTLSGWRRKDYFSPEYIESYQHCRENGNSAGIIIMEILFAYLLILFEFNLWFIISWLMLGFSGWFIGIYLEYKMVEDDKRW